MSVLDRLLLFVYSLAVAALSALLVGQAVGYDLFSDIMIRYNYEILAGMLILFIVSIRFLFYRTGRRQREPESVVQRTDTGEIHISIQTLVSLSERAAKMVRGVQELKTKVRSLESGVRIAIRLTVDPDLDIPQLSQTLQQKVKDYVEASAGVTIEKVLVHVTDVARPAVGKAGRPRVE